MPAAGLASSSDSLRSRLATRTMCCPRAGSSDAERDRVAHQAGVVRDLLDLRRADPVAGRLDHLVAAADEEQESFLVAHHDRVPGKDGHLGCAPARIARPAIGRKRSAVRVRRRSSSPSPPAATVDEFPVLAGVAGRSVRPHDQDLGVGDCLADRVRTAIDLRRVEIGRAEGLGEAVHQIGRALAETAPAACRVSPSAFALRCSRNSAVLRRPRAASSGSAIWIQNGGTPVIPVTLCFSQSRTTSPGRTIVHQHDVRAALNAVVSWLSPASKLSGRTDEDRRRRRLFAEVVADALGADDQIAMAEHDALGLAGASGRVEDRRHVGVDNTGLGAAVHSASPNSSHATTSTAVSARMRRQRSRRLLRRARPPRDRDRRPVRAAAAPGVRVT